MHILLTGNTTFKLANFRAGLIRRLIAEGHQVTVLAPADDYVDKVRAMGCNFVPLEMDRNGTSPRAEARLLASVFANLRRTRPHIVFSYTIKNNIYGGLACRLLGIPFVPNVTGLGPTFNTAGPLNRIVRTLYRIAFRRARMVFFQNRDDLGLFVGSNLVPENRVQLLPGSGVDLARFDATPLPDDTGEIRFLLMARLLWEKGVGLFAEAARQVRQDFPMARFQVLGPLDPDSKSGIDAATLQGWVDEDAIDYLGATQDVVQYLKEAHCLVLPSYYREGTPRSLLEAGAVGRPIITTDMPGCRDTVLDRVSGYLVEARNADELATACQRFLTLSSGERAEMGRASRQHIAQCFDEQIVIGMYLALLVQSGPGLQPVERKSSS